MTQKIIALAPMDGITNNAYRTMCSDVFYNAKNIYQNTHKLRLFTEFMSVE